MSDLREKVSKSIERLKAFEPKDGSGYYLAFSGGKDSVVCKALMDMAGVKYDAHYRVTSVDPPELVQFIRDKHPDVVREIPRDKDGKPITMWTLIPKKLMPPTRLVRYCCAYLKESGGDGRMVVTGVRWAESENRKKNQGIVTLQGGNKAELERDGFRSNERGDIVLTNDNDDTRRMVEQCYRRHKTTVNPIIDWADADVWAFIRAESIPYCTLYDEGFSRLGCIGCPLAKRHSREREFLRWPKYKEQYLRSFQKMLNERARRGKLGGTWSMWTTPQDVFNWWMEYDTLPGQIDLLEDAENGED